MSALLKKGIEQSGKGFTSGALPLLAPTPVKLLMSDLRCGCHKPIARVLWR